MAETLKDSANSKKTIKCGLLKMTDQNITIKVPAEITQSLHWSTVKLFTTPFKQSKITKTNKIR